jgi:hypothetical protein
VLLTSPADVRVVDLVAEVALPAQSYALELECAARSKAGQAIPLANAGSRCAAPALLELPATCPAACHAAAGQGCARLQGRMACIVCPASAANERGLRLRPLARTERQRHSPEPCLPLPRSGMTVVAALSGASGFSGPREVDVPPGGAGSYPLAFQAAASGQWLLPHGARNEAGACRMRCLERRTDRAADEGLGLSPPPAPPPPSGSHSGTLELRIPATGERSTYLLTARVGEPLPEGHLVLECQVSEGPGSRGGRRPCTIPSTGGSGRGSGSAGRCMLEVPLLGERRQRALPQPFAASVAVLISRQLHHYGRRPACSALSMAAFDAAIACAACAAPAPTPSSPPFPPCLPACRHAASW